MYDIYQQSALGVKKCKVNSRHFREPECARIVWSSVKYAI